MALPESKPLFPSTDTQGWSEFQVSHSVAENAEFQVDGGLRWSGDAGHLVYRRVGAGFSFGWRKYFSFAPSYHFYSRDSAPHNESMENRISFAATVQIPFGHWKINDRNLMERRFLKSGNSIAYRNQLELERDVRLARRRFRVFVSDEVFHDSQYHAWIRNRATIGAGKTISRRLSLDFFYMRQNDGFVRPGDLNAFGVKVRTRF